MVRAFFRSNGSCQISKNATLLKTAQVYKVQTNLLTSHYVNVNESDNGQAKSSVSLEVVNLLRKPTP